MIFIMIYLYLPIFLPIFVAFRLAQGEARRRRVEARKAQGTEKKWNYSGKSGPVQGRMSRFSL